jgi:hypothetical protein
LSIVEVRTILVKSSKSLLVPRRPRLRTTLKYNDLELGIDSEYLDHHHLGLIDQRKSTTNERMENSR